VTHRLASACLQRTSPCWRRTRPALPGQRRSQHELGTELHP
jgi:hypothetical protein